jgi:hypothetical protein
MVLYCPAWLSTARLGFVKNLGLGAAGDFLVSRALHTDLKTIQKIFEL